MVKWARRIVVVLVAAFVALYFGDWAVYRMRGSPQGSVKVSQTVVVPFGERLGVPSGQIVATKPSFVCFTNSLISCVKIAITSWLFFLKLSLAE